MKFVFTELSWEDYLFWQKNDKQKLKRINELLKDISRSPYEGIGKPEPLKFNYAGFWSRRIDEEHRLIYRVIDDEIQAYLSTGIGDNMKRIKDIKKSPTTGVPKIIHHICPKDFRKWHYLKIILK